MWPFTGRRIFGSRWWAIAFAIFVCWQVAIFMQPADPDADALNAAQIQGMTDAFNKM